MGNRLLSVPTVTINNDTMEITPNSVSYDGGEGQIMVMSVSAGGGVTRSVHAVNAETQIGKVTFDMKLTEDLDAKIAIWKEDVGANSIQITQDAGNGNSITLSFDNMSLINDVSRNPTPDGNTTLEWQGDKMGIQ